MIFLPIVERELRVTARRHSTYSLRLMVALAAIVISLFFYLANLTAPKQILAQRIFQGVSLLALLYCLASGRRSTADCLSEEKREGTLGLLFLTDLKGYDVILGKLAATSVNGFYCLLAIFPVLAIPLLMGGITSGEFWRMVLVLVNTFLLSLAIGLFVSVLSRNARRAFGANLVLLLLLIAVPAACAGAVAYFSPSHLFIRELMYSCPGYAFHLSSDQLYRWEKGHFWITMAVIHGLSWVLVALASRIAPRCWQDQPAGSDKVRWRDLWRRANWGGAKAEAFRRRLLEVNSFYWLAARSRLKPAGVWAFLGFMACWWLFVRVILQFKGFDEFFALATALMLNCILKVWIAIESGQRLSEDQKIGAMELLLCTPLTVRAILGGQLLALRRQFLKPLLVIITVELVLIAGVSRHSMDNGSAALAFGVTGLIALMMDMSALIWVAMSAALTARSPNHATISTIWRVLMLPWVLYAAICTIVNLVCTGAAVDHPDWKFYLYLWFWLGILADLFFGLPAWWSLRTRFREMALQRSAPSGSFEIPSSQLPSRNQATTGQ